MGPLKINSVQNLLTLRADLGICFELHYLGVDPKVCPMIIHFLAYFINSDFLREITELLRLLEANGSKIRMASLSNWIIFRTQHFVRSMSC